VGYTLSAWIDRTEKQQYHRLDKPGFGREKTGMEITG
jgi:hypothetical protein